MSNICESPTKYWWKYDDDDHGCNLCGNFGDRSDLLPLASFHRSCNSIQLLFGGFWFFIFNHLLCFFRIGRSSLCLSDETCSSIFIIRAILQIWFLSQESTRNICTVWTVPTEQNSTRQIFCMNYHAVHYNTRPFGLLSFFLQNLNQFSKASCKSVFYVNIGFPLKASRRSHKNYCNLKFASQKIFCAQVDCCTPFLPFNHCYKKVLWNQW